MKERSERETRERERKRRERERERKFVRCGGHIYGQNHLNLNTVRVRKSGKEKK